MNAAELVQLATARGIDLNHVAGSASDLQGAAKKRALTADEREQGLRDVQLTVKGRESRVYRPPAWTSAELGQAGAGIGVTPWAAAMYSFAGSHKGYSLLWKSLAQQAIKISRRDGWQPRVSGEDGQPKYYIESLCALVLDEDVNQHVFAAAPALYAFYMGVSPAVRDRDLVDAFRSLKDVYAGWLRVAQAAIGRRIRER